MRHPNRQRRLRDEGRDLAARLLRITDRRGIVARYADIKPFTDKLAPNLAGVTATLIDAPRPLTLISAPYSAFVDPRLGAELEAVRKALDNERRRAIVVPIRSILVRTLDIPREHFNGRSGDRSKGSRR